MEGVADIVEENVAWKGEVPTAFITNSFDKGLIKVGQTIVDIGCGFGRNSNWLESRGVQVTGVNIDRQELEACRNNAKKNNLKTNFIEGSVINLPLATSSFDVAIDYGCSHMLGTDDQLGAAKEQARVVKPGGILLYFGFTKDHPAATANKSSSMYRDLSDIQRQYGQDFEIVSSEPNEWKPVIEEKANFDIHRGINIVMRRKGRS